MARNRRIEKVVSTILFWWNEREREALMVSGCFLAIAVEGWRVWEMCVWNEETTKTTTMCRVEKGAEGELMTF